MQKNQRIKIRVTEKEKDYIIKKAEERKTTVTALILNAVENNIAVNLDTSDYRDLVIQVRGIGHNVNSLLKRIHYNNFITGDDILEIKMKLKILESLLNDQKKNITKAKNGIENLTVKLLKEYLEKENMKIPMYLIYDEISEQIIFLLLDFIDLLKKEKFLNGYPPYIEVFLKKFNPYLYSYREIVDFYDELNEVVNTINRKVITEIGKTNQHDFEKVLDVLQKYRKNEN